MVVPRRWCSFLISVRISTRSLASEFDKARRTKDLRIAHQGAAHRHALPLPAGKLGGLAIQQMFHLQERGNLLHRRLAPRLIDAAHFETEGDIPRHIHVRVQRVGLKHHSDVAVLQVDIVDDAPVDLNGAVGDRIEARDHVQQGRFPAAGRAEQHEFPIGQLKVNPLEDRNVP